MAADADELIAPGRVAYSWDQPMGYELSTFDERTRVVAQQATDFACAAASVADVVCDLLGIAPFEIARVQRDLISDLGGLRSSGTTLDQVAIAAFRRFKERLIVFQPLRMSWEAALNLVGRNTGVVVGLAPHAGTIGHAVRILGSSRPLRQADEDPMIADLVHPPAFSDLIHRVQYFDPWPEFAEPVMVETWGAIRPRFDAFHAPSGPNVLYIQLR